MSRASPRPAPSHRWTLSPEALGRFLLILDPDLAIAGQRYERLRQKLIRIFEWRGCVFAEDLADEALNRVIRKTEEGIELNAEAVPRYAAGVAHRVHLEHLRNAKRQRPRPGDASRTPWVRGHHETTSLRLIGLERCLESLPADDRELILRYYAGESGERIRNRRDLASELGIAAGNLRIRAYRIRARLEKHLAGFLRQPPAMAPAGFAPDEAAPGSGLESEP